MGKMFVYLTMPGHRPARPRLGILALIVALAMSKQDTSVCFQRPDQIRSLHAIRNSAARRTPGLRPLVNSSKRSLRFS